MIYRAQFDGEPLLPEDQRTQYPWDTGDNPLPQDGLPRITSEGMSILLEGLRGDFRRWCWGIGNHPLQMPNKHTRNLYITAMKDRPHFLAKFYYGDRFPRVGYMIFTAYSPFDTVDTYTTEEGASSSGIRLCQAADHYAAVPVQVDDANIWEAPEPQGAPRRDILDAWLEAEL